MIHHKILGEFSFDQIDGDDESRTCLSWQSLCRFARVRWNKLLEKPCFCYTPWTC